MRRSRLNCSRVALIALYELKTLWRNRGLRMLLFIFLLLTAFLHFVAHCGLFFHLPRVSVYHLSAIPYANACIGISLQVLLMSFFGGNFFLRREDSVLSTVYSPRPYTSGEFFWGKFAGFFLLQLELSLLFTSVALLIHLFATDSPFALFPYVFYLLTLSAPVLFLFTALTFLLKGLMRHVWLPVLFVLPLFYALVGPWQALGDGLFDLLSLTRPNMFSEVTGFSAPGLYLLQRFFLFTLGLSFLFFAARFVRRLSSRRDCGLILGISVILFACFLAGVYCQVLNRSSAVRDAVRATYVRYGAYPPVEVRSHAISFYPRGKCFSAVSDLVLCNRYSGRLDTVLLYLNPGLDVDAIEIGGERLSFRRDNQALFFPSRLERGDSVRVRLSYGGRISPSVFYPENTRLDTLESLSRRYFMYNAGRDYFYVSSDQVLLTPESLWYPRGVAPVNVVSPPLTMEEYTLFSLEVHGVPGLSVISQGSKSEEEGVTRFTNRFPLPGLSLCMGRYNRYALTLNGVSYEAYVYDGHESLLPEDVDPYEVLEHWEQRNSNYDYLRRKSGYVFDKLCWVETPLHFCAHGRGWKEGGDQVSVELLFRPEREVFGSRLSSRGINNEDPTIEFSNQYNILLMDDLLEVPRGNLFASGLTGNYRIERLRNAGDASFLQDRVHYYSVYSVEFPWINTFFNCMQRGLQDRFGEHYFFYGPEETLQISLLEACQMGLDEDVIYRLLLKRGYPALIALLDSVSPRDIERFNARFLQEHNFSNFSYEEYCSAVEREFGFSLLSLTRSLYEARGFPAFNLQDFRVNEVYRGDEAVGCVFSCKVWNQSAAGGYLSFRNAYHPFGRHYYIPGNGCKTVKVYVDEPYDKNSSIIFRTNSAQNLPGDFHFDLEDLPRYGRLTSPVDGIFDLDTLFFSIPANEYVVDDSDPGFRIIEEGRWWHRLGKMVQRGYWSESLDQGAYGDNLRTFTERNSLCPGNIISDAEWRVQLPSPGDYELFVYNNPHFFGRLYFPRERSFAQKYSFECGNGKKTFTLYPLTSKRGWVSMGVYPFPAGEAAIRLSGKRRSNMNLMYADAVKWVKIR